MRRSAPLALPVLLLLALAAPPSHAGFAQCVSSGGVTVCPTAVSQCTPNDTIRVTVQGVGRGLASCGGGDATCTSVRTGCTADARAGYLGTMTCAATGSAVAICSVVVAAS